MTRVAVCFDLDDTLYPYADYARAGLQAAADHLERRTGRQLGDELHRLYFEEGVTAGTFDHLLDRYEDLPSDIVDDLVEAYHGSTGPLDTYESTEPVLRRLGTDGFRLGLVTDGRNGHEKLERLDLADYFDATVVTPTIDSSKREAEPFEQVLRSIAAEPGQTVYVGDDPRVDFAVPNRLGMDTVRLRRGRYADLEPDDPESAPDVEIDSLRRLPSVLAARPLPPRAGCNATTDLQSVFPPSDGDEGRGAADSPAHR